MTREASSKSPIEQIAVSNMEQLQSNPYPGRGIVMGFNKELTHAVQVYWVMGRSANSRNRVLVQDEDIVRTEPFDVSKVEDPSLIIYTAMRAINGMHIVSNGDQTDSVAEVIGNGGTFEKGLSERTYEPDEPNFTPRITGQYRSDSDLPFSFSVIRKNPTADPEPLRTLRSYKPGKGIGQCIHTYKGDGNPLPSFDSDPYPVLLEGSVEEIAQTYWDLLDKDNRVALVAKGVDTITGEVSLSIINQLSR